MELRPLGRTGLRVSPLCLGTMMFGTWGNHDHADSIRTIHAALDAGINLVDTADVYAQGETEEIVGAALAGSRRDDVILATKCHYPMGADSNRQGNSRRWIVRAVDHSLRRLGTDWIDLYQLHRPDPLCDLEETIGALTDLVRAGKVRYIGTSCFPTHMLVDAQWIAATRHLERMVCEQPPYSLLARGIEADVLPVCEERRVGVITWSPLAGGWLSGKVRRGAATPDHGTRTSRVPDRYDMSLPANLAKLDAVEQLADLADDSAMTLMELAVAFVLRHPTVTAAIIGPRSSEQLTPLLTAAARALDDSVLDRIDAIVPPGTTINPADAGWSHPALAQPQLRRRPPRGSSPNDREEARR